MVVALIPKTAEPYAFTNMLAIWLLISQQPKPKKA
jgi:hypothetical protein